MSMTRFARSLSATLCMWGAACGGGSAPDDEANANTSGSETTVTAEPAEPPPPPAPRPVPVRVLHLAVGAASATVDASAGPPDAPLASMTGLAFKVPSAYQEVTPPSAQANVPVTVQVSGGATASLEAPVREGVPATLFVLTSPEDPTQVVLTATEDDAQAVTGQIRARFVNAMVGVPAIDFCLPGASRREPGRPIFSNVQYGQVAGTETGNHYLPVSLAGGAQLQIRASADNGCTGRVLGSVDIPPPDASTSHNLTLAVVGRQRPRVAPELLVCEDAPGESGCTAIPIR